MTLPSVAVIAVVASALDIWPRPTAPSRDLIFQYRMSKADPGDIYFVDREFAAHEIACQWLRRYPR